VIEEICLQSINGAWAKQLDCITSSQAFAAQDVEIQSTMVLVVGPENFVNKPMFFISIILVIAIGFILMFTPEKSI